MLFLVLAGVFMASVSGQGRDPTKVCLPDVFQTTFVSAHQNIGGIVAYDFTQHVVAVQYATGVRRVFNLTDLSSATINQTSGVCTRGTADENIRTFNSQCLPASAKLWTGPGTYLGLKPDSLSIEGWEYDVPNFGHLRVVVTTTSPSVPLLRQFESSSSLPSDEQVLASPKTGIENTAIFNVPAGCSSAVIVG